MSLQPTKFPLSRRSYFSAPPCLTPPCCAGASSLQAYKRLSSLLLTAAELATACGSAHPPPLLRRLQARLLQELPALAALPGENVRLAAAQLAAFVPCSILEAAAGAAAYEAAAADGNSNGNGDGDGDGSSDAEIVMVEAPAAAHSNSGASLEAVPAGACKRGGQRAGGGLPN